MFTRSAIAPPEVNGFGWNLGRVYCLELAMTDFGRGPRRSKSGRPCGSFFLSGKQRTTLPIFGQPNFTKFAHNTWFCDVVNPFGIFFWKFALNGSFFQKTWSSSTISDFKPRFLGNDYKSWKIMTGWRAYEMLAFHPYRRNQLKVIPLASRLRTRKDCPMQSPYTEWLIDASLPNGHAASACSLPWRDITLL